MASRIPDTLSSMFNLADNIELQTREADALTLFKKCLDLHLSSGSTDLKQIEKINRRIASIKES